MLNVVHDSVARQAFPTQNYSRYVYFFNLLPLVTRSLDFEQCLFHES